jgi:hypothetical protein
MSEVRLAIDRALSKLLGRFGPPSEVIGELRAALAALDKAEAAGAKESAPAQATLIPETAAAEAEEEVEAEPPPTKTPRKRSMGKKGYR